ncbi:hypothetical protein TRIATDRAFT_94297 [Trichoderma atroviride IMI 206040]|uniref:Glycoside hydrolase family 2 protein n=1 Tax=Hypocrea atroviridis (strain ATCC 20476 / IMI 206040) TaxID=452589 RepID=G9NE21_HYPAI|nr:uncharacterized protein TRIATDRAFT_94297 [Trichoderma atroviride IMI 206040]EHK51100.1 hypothetical protein TRIATDRAFT_94297 [Trichoderma atroviride IMI 206040]
MRTSLPSFFGIVVLATVSVAVDKSPGFGQRPALWIAYDVPTEFANPIGLARPSFRYWVPDADVDDSVLYADLQEIKAAGWGGVEIICLENYGIEPAVVDPAIYGYGGGNWRGKFGTMLRASQDLDLLVDFALGPTQGASIPILDPDSPGMNTELAYGSVSLSSGQTFDGPIPPPGRTDAGYANKPDFSTPVTNFTNKFVAAVVARKSKDNRVTQLDFDSVNDITNLVKDGILNYTSPADGNDYVLFTFYQRRTGYLAAQGAFNNATTPNNPASWFAYVVDHFSQEGTDLWTGFTEKYVMNGGNGDLLAQLGMYAWEDSAEFRATLFWTDELSSYFRQTRDYDITTALPALFGTTGLPPSTLANSYFYYGFNDHENGTDISWKLRNDYYQCLQELYEQYHLDGLSKWTSKWNIQGSLQPYATAPNAAPPWDMNSAAAHIDAPETESNYFDGVIDAFRAMGGGAMMGKKQIFSSELGAHRYEAYAITWPVILNDCKINYAGGVNRIVTHGFPYSGIRPQVEWPGLTTFEWLYSEMWGPRQPSWAHVQEMGDWIARTQIILQTGVPRVDIGIYRHKYLSVDIKHYNMGENIFWDHSLQNAGYSYVSVSPSLLKLDNAVVTNGLLAEDGPGFSAFIVDNSTNITSEAVDRFTEYASSGYSIIFVGSLPETTPYYCDSCDQYVKQEMQKLLTYPTVRSLESESEVVNALKELNIQPAAENLSPVPILYVHRIDVDNRADYYWVYNSDIYQDHATVASIKGTGIPYTLDAWTGAIDPILNYTISGDRFNIWIELQSNQSTILAFAPKGFFSKTQAPDVHVVKTNVEYLSYSASSHSIIARSSSQGQKAIALSNGHNFTLSGFQEQTTPLELGPWNVTIQDWLPNPDRFNNYTSIFQYHNLNLDTLIPWYNISGLSSTSGLGTYTTHFAWNPTKDIHGALIDLGPVFNTIRLWINGHWTGPIDITDAIVDITPFLIKGLNDVKIEVSSTLRNRLLQVNVTQSWEQSQYASSYGGQPYGLSAPVKLIPFTEIRIPV